MITYKRLFTLFTVALSLSLGGIGGVTETYAQSTQLKIGVVDTQRVIQASQAYKQTNQKVEGLRGQFQQEFKLKEQNLVTENQKLVRQKSILAPEVYAQKKADIDKQAAIIRSQAKERKNSINQLRNAGLKQIQSKLGQIIDQMVAAHGFDLIIAKQSLVWTKPSLDITDEVVQKLNTSLPSVVLQ
ncbi:OmpH family outer membrane protein [Kiloniella antarctica]|uniref:OmpH family outer membrane protein n=1 Tax=Kiloniella antarctica TaxID=1550907 RepID=A0ABW5BMF0_9PROT